MFVKRARVIVAEFEHETNCFSPAKAGRREFEEWFLKDSDEVIPFFKCTNTVVGGFIAASEKEGFDIIPIMAACAVPCGLVTRDMFDFAKNKIIQAIKDTKNLDGVLLFFHGAMVSEAGMDSEGDLLRAIRNAVGAEMPVVAVLDLHGNLTKTMVENANAFFPYETYPHTDCFERGYEAGNCIVKMVRGEIAPVMKYRRILILAHLIETTHEPHAELLNRVHKWEENPKVINVAVMHGFAWSDIPDAGMSVIAVTDGDSKLADDIVSDMAKTIWERRDKLWKKFLSPEEAIREAMEFPAGPIIIADTADNPGGGGTGDSTFILRALLKAGAKNVGVAVIPDRQAVQQAIDAGVGSRVTLDLGGKLGPKEITGGPVEITAMVKTIFDGQFINKDLMWKGMLNQMGRTVVLDADGIEIIVPERRIQPWDAEIFRRAGIEPTEKKIIVLKSAVHFKGSFGPMAKRILDVDTPEYLTMSFESLNFKNITRPVYPLDKDFEYT